MKKKILSLIPISYTHLGTNIMDRHVNVPEYRSKVGMVFQNFNLFSNMTVLKNCTVGQEKVLKKSKEEAQKNAMMYLEKVGMAPVSYTHLTGQYAVSNAPSENGRRRDLVSGTAESFWRNANGWK